MNLAQWAYMIGLAALFVWRGPSFAAWVLLGNAIATLSVCLAMDLDVLGRQDATLFMMLIDLASGVALMTDPGLSRLLALGYAVTVPIYSASVVFGVAETTTFAVVVGVGMLQLVVAGFGQGGDDNGSRRRLCADLYLVAVPSGNPARRIDHDPANTGVGEGLRHGR